MAEGRIVAAALVPGMPHVLAGQPAPSWTELREAAAEVERRLRDQGAEALVVMSTQWFTVLGIQVQMDPNPKGMRLDENWYDFDYGSLPYDLRVDVALGSTWAEELERDGADVHRTRYDGFPIDTGTVVAQHLLDPRHRMTMALASMNLYADAEAMTAVGAAAARAVGASGRRVGVVAVSGLSSGLFQEWIDPAGDRLYSAEHDEWNRRVLDLLASGRLDEALDIRAEYAKRANVDSQFRALTFLAGTGAMRGRADVLAYGPIWGTGAAVVHWSEGSV